MSVTVVFGGPGVGKTTEVVAQTGAHVEEHGVLNLLVITFSREGAEDMSRKLGNDVTVLNHHRLAGKIVRMGARMRKERAPKIINEKRARKRLEHAIVKKGLHVEAEDVEADMRRVREKGQRIETVAPASQQVIPEYLDDLRKGGEVDFTGLLERAAEELQVPELADTFEGYYLKEDETQDVNPYVEWWVLEPICRRAKEMVAYSSPSQCIYRFRGADWPEMYQRLGDLGEVATEYRTVNKRNTPEILAAASLLAGMDAKHMTAERPSIGSPVCLVDAISPEMEVDAVTQQIAEWRQDYPLRNMAVLTRRHNDLLPVERSLRQHGIPFRINGTKGDFLTGTEVQALTGYLKLAREPMNDLVLESIINFPPDGFGVKTLGDLRGDGRLTWNHLVDALARPKDFRPQVIRRIHKILDLREQWNGLMDVRGELPDIIGRVMEEAGIDSYLMDCADWNALQALEALARSAKEYRTLDEFVEYLEQEARRPRNTEGVTLSTLHAAKGLEYDCVVIHRFSEGVLPLARQDPIEEQNLAYVAMTRARDHLTVTVNRREQPSPLLSGMPVQSECWP